MIEIDLMKMKEVRVKASSKHVAYTRKIKSKTLNLVQQYQRLCQELNLMPYSVMNPNHMKQKVDEMMGQLRKTPGSQYYMM